MPEEPIKQLPQIEILRPGKDEMNLVEYPFAALRRDDANDSVIKIEWENHHPISDRSVKALWRVAGDPVWGLPTASDERVYLVLMEISREMGFSSPLVNFSCYDLLRRLAWSDNQKHYNLLRDTFERLKSVNIITRNAFWNHKHKSFVNTGFSLIEFYELLTEKPGRKKTGERSKPNSYFKWNDVMFSSMQAGFLKTVDLDLALSLRSPIAVRLYRYLDKKAWDGRATFEIELCVLCERHLAMAPNPYPSKLKERLKTAHEELLERGFLAAVEYEPMTSKKGEKVRYTFARPRTAALPEDPAPRQDKADSAATIDLPPMIGGPMVGMLPKGLQPSLFTAASQTLEALEFGAPEALAAPSEPEPSDAVAGAPIDEGSELLERMLGLKVSPEVARELLSTVGPEDLRLQLDCLESREPRDPAAVFVKAAREGWDAPAKYLQAQERRQRFGGRTQSAREFHEAARAAQKAAEREVQAQADAETQSLDALWETLDAATRRSIEDAARERLGVLGRSGRASAAQDAMRRTLLRERLAQAKA